MFVGLSVFAGSYWLTGMTTKGKILAFLYLWLELDPVSWKSWILGRPKGSVHRELIQKRTGENFSKMQNVEELLKSPTAYQVL